MDFVIKTTRDAHAVRDEAACRRKQAALVSKRQRAGVRVSVHEVAATKTARVDHGRWLIDCECGAGVMADPDFTAAYCLGCGAVHTAVTFPLEADRLDVEHILLARPRSANRSWDPGSETLLDLAIENAEHGVRW